MPKNLLNEPYTILLASGSPNRDRIVTVLNNLRSNCTLVDTGNAAIEALTTGKYDILVTDYTLDDIDIWRLSAIVHSDRFGPTIPILLLHELDEVPVPSVLTRDYEFASISSREIDQLPSVIEHHLSATIKPTLLIVEDDSEAVEIAEYALSNEYTVTVAENGEEGLKAWRTQRHDLILLDLMLPDISGETVLRQILDTDYQQPVIVVTADGKIESHKKLLLSGAIEFISKPYKLNDLRRICRVTINKARLMKEAEQHLDLLNLVTRHVWAASYSLQTGDLPNASTHLDKIMQALPNALPSDDARAMLV